MKKEKFFSVIIPAYNCSKTLSRLLDSIVKQKQSDLEVIICDDNSSEKLEEVFSKYEKDLEIIYCQTKTSFHCPGNTRSEGLKYASGEWITFIDNDDMFEDDVFDKIKEYINKTNEQYIVCSNFREWNIDNNILIQEFKNSDTDTWLHGKWFNKKNFIDAFNIDFKKDLFSHEDVYFNSLCLGHLIGNNRDYNYLDLFTYKWIYNPSSLSRKFFNEKHYYIEVYLRDYIIATSEPFFKMIKLYPKQKEFYKNQILMGLLHSYFYFESFKYRLGNEILSENLMYLHDLKLKINIELNMSDIDIINYIYQSPVKYNNIKLKSMKGSCQFIESESFKDFILKI